MSHIVRGLAEHHDLTQWRAIDLGCLEGHYTDILCSFGFKEVVAVDLSRENVARAAFLLRELKQYANATVLHGDVEDEAFLRSLGTFDLVLFHGILYHMQDPLGMMDRITRIGSDRHVLLLSTQFKFGFAEVVTPSRIADLKFRSIPRDDAGLVKYEGTSSTYASMAMRLNPASLERLLVQYGYCDLTGYDTPLGCTYGLQVSLVAARSDMSAVRTTWNRPHAIPGLQFYSWHWTRLDGFDMARDVRARLARLAVRVAYRIAEMLGQSHRRQLERAQITARARKGSKRSA
jgi:hypothetical protein